MNIGALNYRIKVSESGFSEIRNRFIGGLHRPNWIPIPDAEKFKGVRVHTADWPEKVDLKGKKVALIGSGASAIQVLPELFKEKNNCAKVIQFQRTPAKFQNVKFQKYFYLLKLI